MVSIRSTIAHVVLFLTLASCLIAWAAEPAAMKWGSSEVLNFGHSVVWVSVGVGLMAIYGFLYEWSLKNEKLPKGPKLGALFWLYCLGFATLSSSAFVFSLTATSKLTSGACQDIGYILGQSAGWSGLGALLCGWFEKRTRISAVERLRIATLLLPYSLALLSALATVILIPFLTPPYGRITATTNKCINNLRQIEGAKQQWAMDFHLSTNAVPTEKDLAPYLNYRSKQSFLFCPLQGKYSLNGIGMPPTCSIEEHQLP